MDMKKMDMYRRQSHFRQLFGFQQTYCTMQATFPCGCGNGRRYKITQALQQHQNTAGHKRKFDPEFAAAEEAELPPVIYT